MLSNLPMKNAIGTSLAIIAAKSLLGFLGDLSVITIDWKLLIGFTSLAVAGIFLGHQLSHKIENARAELDVVHATRLKLERNVKLMRSDSLDLDLLDEQARRLLGYADKDEKIYNLN